MNENKQTNNENKTKQNKKKTKKKKKKKKKTTTVTTNKNQRQEQRKTRLGMCPKDTDVPAWKTSCKRRTDGRTGPTHSSNGGGIQKQTTTNQQHTQNSNRTFLFTLFLLIDIFPIFIDVITSSSTLLRNPLFGDTSLSSAISIRQNMHVFNTFSLADPN